MPAVLVLAFQDEIARALLGAGGVGLPTGGLTIGLLAAYGLFFLLGFVLFALIYAAVGSFVSRPTTSRRCRSRSAWSRWRATCRRWSSCWAVAGRWAASLLFVPPLSPFAMLSRLMVSDVKPWEVALSIGILVATIGLVAVATVRIYATGVLLYGQRPGSGRSSPPPVARADRGRGGARSGLVFQGRRLSMARTGAVAEVGSSGASASSDAGTRRRRDEAP